VGFNDPDLINQLPAVIYLPGGFLLFIFFILAGYLSLFCHLELYYVLKNGEMGDLDIWE